MGGGFLQMTTLEWARDFRCVPLIPPLYTDGRKSAAGE